MCVCVMLRHLAADQDKSALFTVFDLLWYFFHKVSIFKTKIIIKSAIFQ